MKKLTTLLAALLFFGVLNLYAPPGDPGDGPGGGDPPVGDPPVGVPIDGGAVALLIAGAAYGAKKLKHKISKDKEEIDTLSE
ncbi:MAG: hypothetical protein PHE33_01805 [Bacteroidales bacterium]|nr:hypothetical protein [Bacteroidales bacterium]